MGKKLTHIEIIKIKWINMDKGVFLKVIIIILIIIQ